MNSFGDTCPHCGSLVSAFATICPTCQQPCKPSVQNWDVAERLVTQILSVNPLAVFHRDAMLTQREQLGEGGMGEVYRVIDKRLGREAALKALKPSAIESRRKRFLREAKITARLDHPSIPPLYEAGETSDGQLYMLMKVIKGDTLEQFLERKKRSDSNEELRARLAIFLKICEAIEYAHHRGVIHRDIKPANIMIGKFGEVMVMDWGLARDCSESNETDMKIIEPLLTPSVELTPAQVKSLAPGVTIPGTLLGTPGYASPEQIVGENVDNRADVFALGTVLTELITAEPAIQGHSGANLIMSVLDNRVLTPRKQGVNVPRDLDFICEAATQTKLESRTQSVQRLRLQVEAVLNHEEVPGYSYSGLERVTRLLQRRALPAVMALLIVSLAVVAFGAWQQFRARPELAKNADPALPINESKPERKPKSEIKTLKPAPDASQELRNLLNSSAPLPSVRAAVNQYIERPEAKASDLLNTAQLLRGAGFDHEANEVLRRSIREFPTSEEAYYQLHKSIKCRRWNQFRDGQILLTLLEQPDSENKWSAVLAIARAWQAAAGENWTEVATIVEGAQVRGMARPVLLGILAFSKFQNGQLQEAKVLCEKARSEEPGWLFEDILWAEIETALNGAETGTRVYRSMIAGREVSADLLIAFGYHLLRRRDSGANQLANLACQLEPSSSSGTLLRARTSSQLTQAWRSALSDYKLCWKLTTEKNLDALIGLVLAHEALERSDEAKKLLNAQRLDIANHKELYLLACLLESGIEAKRKAIKAVKSAFRAKSDKHLVEFSEGFLQLARGNPTGAETHFVAAQSDPECFWQTPAYLAACYKLQGKTRELNRVKMSFSSCKHENLEHRLKRIMQELTASTSEAAKKL